METGLHLGRNGRGKTTFLRLLLGTYPYQGSIQAPVRFDYFPYEVPDPQETTLNCVREVVSPFAAWEAEMAACLERNGPGDLDRYGELQLRYAQQGGYEIDGLVRRELGKLGLGEEPLGRPFATLSNGERTKALLAALFLKRNNFLLIDEPTNHLDLAGRDLLAEYLRGKRGFILVSHDRAFLDRCVDHVLSINRNSIEVQRGNYTTWQQNKDLQDRYELERNEQLKGEIGRLRRGGDPHRRLVGPHRGRQDRRARWGPGSYRPHGGQDDEALQGHRAPADRGAGGETRPAQERRTGRRPVPACPGTPQPPLCGAAGVLRAAGRPRCSRS